MELTRRTFSGMLIAAAAAWWTGVWRLAGRAAPRRVLRAVRARLFPGHVRPLDPNKVRRPGAWRG